MGSSTPDPPLCLALSEQLQVEPCLSQTVAPSIPPASLSDSCDVHLSFFGPKVLGSGGCVDRIVPSLLNSTSLFLQTD